MTKQIAVTAESPATIMLSDLPRRRYVGFVKSACKMYIYCISLSNVILLSTDIYVFIFTCHSRWSFFNFAGTVE